MKNRDIAHAHEEVEMLKAHYRPSLNMWRFTKSILGVLIFGRSTVARSYVRNHKNIW